MTVLDLVYFAEASSLQQFLSFFLGASDNEHKPPRCHPRERALTRRRIRLHSLIVDSYINARAFGAGEAYLVQTLLDLQHGGRLGTREGVSCLRKLSSISALKGDLERSKAFSILARRVSLRQQELLHPAR